ncbi:MAG: sigma 54-interacting transcriptional regulator [Bacillota bacterium]|nr:sigma 54-interacting transcriptional regulator [Bacillota bacterium]
MPDLYYESILDVVEEGLVVIDMSGKIKTYNRRAKEITGILLSHSKPHESGQLERGDLVIIADNRLGYDDGGLSSGDLKKIGIDDNDIAQGEAFVAIGLYDTPKIKGVHKNWRNRAGNDRLIFQTQFDNRLIEVEIDIVKKTIDIKVDGDSHKMRYSLAIGHMVAYSHQHNDVKFYQARGYSIRNETVAELLEGKPFKAKGNYEETIDVIDMPIGKVFDSPTLLSRIETCIAGENDYFINEYYEIHKRPTVCSLMPLKGNKEVLLKLIDVSNIEALITERNRMIVTMEKTNKSLDVTSDPKTDWISDGIIGYSSAMQRIKYLAQRAAMTKSTVLITGESGTGKTFIAREIHNLMFKNSERPFISVNCTAIPQNLFESELFGYNKGAFTGAEKSGKPGFFELAENGTLFLDEIGELPLEMQVKLLHVLQSKKFYKVGATTPTSVNVRIIAATNKDLAEEIQKKNFREDLYYRINGFPIEIPPLRKRKSDLFPLINNAVEKLTKDFDGARKLLSGEALDLLLQYDWPGNIRELENTIELAYNMSDGAWIREEDLNLPIKPRASMNLREHLDFVEREYILEKLNEVQYDVKKAIHCLSISKSVFYEKIKKHKIILNRQHES